MSPLLPGTPIHASSIHVIFQIHLLCFRSSCVTHSLSCLMPSHTHMLTHGEVCGCVGVCVYPTQLQNGGQVIVLRDEASIENTVITVEDLLLPLLFSKNSSYWLMWLMFGLPAALSVSGGKEIIMKNKDIIIYHWK